jgi:hypothetical protein
MCYPWATIQWAANSAKSGQTIVVEDGTYPEAIRVRRGGSAAAAITIKSRHKWGAKIAPADTSGNDGRSVYVTAPFVVIQDFEIIATPVSNAAIKLDGEYDSAVGNNVHDVGVSTAVCTPGAGVVAGGENDSIIGNRIYNIGPPRTAAFRCNKQHGIYITGGSGGHLQSNMIFQIWQGWAIHFWAPGWSNWMVTENTIFNNGDNGHDTGGSFALGCLGGFCDGNIFSNNIVAHTQGGFGCFWEYKAPDSYIGPGNVFSNNVLYDCGSPGVKFGVSQNNMLADPQFVRYTGEVGGDYRVQSTSPALLRPSRPSTRHRP